MSGVALYERTEALAIVDQWLMESGGELTPEIEELLEQAAGQWADKVERVALKVRELEATAKAVKEEADRLAARVKALENGARSLKGYLQQQLNAIEVREVKRPLVTVRLQNSPPAARCAVPVEALPPELVRVIPERREFDARAALAAHKAGAALPAGVEIVQGTHVRLY